MDMNLHEKVGPVAERDLRLDFWRGLCILDMVLVHLIEQGLHAAPAVSSLITDYTRFAAGGFVFVSGLCVGAIHLNKARDPARRGKVYRGMLFRAGFILAVHYVSTLSFMLLCPLYGERVDLRQTLVDIILLRQGYDLLPFYVCMIALGPVMLELVRRGLWWVLGGASLIAFAVGTHDPWWIGFPEQQCFFPMLWQLIFVAGLLAGSQLRRYDQFSHGMKLQIFLGGSAVAVILTTLSRLEQHGVALPWEMMFVKVPLSPPELLRYLALTAVILVGTDLLWSRIEPLAVRAFVNRLGRRSLGLAVLHVWVVMGVLELAPVLPQRAATPLLLAGASVAALWVLARMLDQAETSWKANHPHRPRFEHVAVPALAAAIIVCLAVVNPLVSHRVLPGATMELADGPDPMDDEPATPIFDPDDFELPEVDDVTPEGASVGQEHPIA